MITFAAGSFECRPISDGERELPAEVMFAGHSGDPIAVPYGSLLIRSEDLIALVDAGLGVATRRALLSDAAASGRVVAASHIRTAGTVERTSDGLRLRPS